MAGSAEAGGAEVGAGGAVFEEEGVVDLVHGVPVFFGVDEGDLDFEDVFEGGAGFGEGLLHDGEGVGGLFADVAGLGAAFGVPAADAAEEEEVAGADGSAGDLFFGGPGGFGLGGEGGGAGGAEEEGAAGLGFAFGFHGERLPHGGGEVLEAGDPGDEDKQREVEEEDGGAEEAGEEEAGGDRGGGEVVGGGAGADGGGVEFAEAAFEGEVVGVEGPEGEGGAEGEEGGAGGVVVLGGDEADDGGGEADVPGLHLGAVGGHAGDDGLEELERFGVHAGL